MRKVQIQVLASPGCGKSTISYIIANALREAGFKVELEDKDHPGEDHFLPEKIKERVQFLSSMVDIKVDMIQTSREPITDC